jgi:hypothetical protein
MLFVMRIFQLILTTTLIVFADYLFAQHTFEKTFSRPEDQIINNVIEDKDGNYIMAGRIKDTESTFYSGYIIKVDTTGNLLQEEIISPNDSISSLFFNIHLFNNHFYILGSQMVSYPDTSKLWYLKLNSNMEIEDEKLLNIPIGRWFSYMNSIIDSDTNIVITGYTTRFDTVSPSPYNNDPFFFKISILGDSLSSNFISNDYHLSLSYDIIEKVDNSGYFSFGFKYSSSISAGSQRYELTKQFDSIEILSVPYNINGYVSSSILNDSIIVLCGSGGSEPAPEYSLNVLSTTFNNTPLNYNYFKMEDAVRDYSGYYQNIDIFDNSIYISGTSNFDYVNPFWSTFNSWYHLVKLNSDFSSIWEYWYGGDAYYFLYGILATNDGGCIMVGNRYDYETQNQERDIYIVKVDSNGLVTWSQEIPVNSLSTMVYPNPGTGQLNIKTSINNVDFELINLNGQVVIRKRLDENQSDINTEILKSGIYFYRLIDKKNKAIETGKWIKK